MQDDWLIGVLSEIHEYAIGRELAWLSPLVEKAYVAARLELKPTTPILLGSYLADRQAIGSRIP